MSTNNHSSPHIGVGFIEILFALAAGEAFLKFFDANLVTRSHLIVALVAIALSWIGYHKTPSPSKEVSEFWGGSIIQFVVDIVIVGLYYALVLAAEKPSLSVMGGMVTEGALLTVIFGAYGAWDVLDLVIQKQAKDKAAARKRLIADVIGFLVMLGIFLVLWLLYKGVSKEAVVLWDSAYIVALYGYRLLQDRLA